MRWLLVVGLFVAACDGGGVEIQDQTVHVACGMCRFGLEDPERHGCYWAAQIDGRVVPIGGTALPRDHENHAPDGMCNVTREAVVSGTLYEKSFVASEFELQPVDPAAEPEFTPEHVH